MKNSPTMNGSVTNWSYSGGEHAGEIPDLKGEGHE